MIMNKNDKWNKNGIKRNGIMRFLTIGFIICQIIVLSEAEKEFGTHFPSKSRKNHDTDLQVSQIRYRPDQDHPLRNFPNQNENTRREFDLPVTFRAPHYEARDYWHNKQNHHNRRTLFQDFSYNLHDKTTAFPDFYQFMTSIFAGKDEITPEFPDLLHYNRDRVTPPYPFDTLFNFRPTEPNYIPPPKPIRASVIKLETITRSPTYPSFEYEVTKKTFPHAETILKQALIETSKTQKNLDFHTQELLKIPPFKSLPVLPKPRYIPPTTLKPTHLRFLHNQTPGIYNYFNRTDYKYPKSVQDQLPNLNQDKVRIPYISEKPIPQIFSALSTESTSQRQFSYDEGFFPYSDSQNSNLAKNNNLGLTDIRTSEFMPETNTGRRERLNGNLRGIKFEYDTTTAKSFPGAVERIKRPTFKYTKKLTAQLDRSSIERVANLTVQGFSKTENGKIDSHNFFNHFNVKDLINYEMRNFENISQNASGATQTKIKDSLMRLVNLNDELSLDAKILKDTNWDGLTVPPTSMTTEGLRETTTLQSFQHVNSQLKNKTAFWEIIQEQKMTPSVTSETATEASTTTEQNKLQTTPEFILWPSTPEVTEISEFFTTEGTTTRTEVQRRSENHFNQKYLKPVMEDSETSGATNLPERMTSRKRYSRRPKTLNFTPYPKLEEFQKKLIIRNHFPKRQKPNITLAFGNKQVLKNRQNLEKDEVMKFLDEDVRKRKIEKRRQVFKRIRISTSGRPVQND